MSVVSDSEQRDVEQRPVGSKRVGAVEALQCRLVRGGGLLRRQALGRDRVNIVVGNRDARKERVARHPVVAVGMVVRHEPFVAPEPVHAAPWKARRDCRRCKPFIKPPGRRSARQADREGAVARLRESAEPFGDIVRKRFGILECAVSSRCGVRHGATAFVSQRAVSNSRRSRPRSRSKPNIADPATIASAPASTASAALSPFCPPSTSIHGSSPFDAQSRRSSRIFGSISGRNFCPPNPGLTVITRTTSQRCSTCSTNAIGLAGIEHRAGLLAQFPNAREHAMEVDRRRRLGLNKKVIGAGFGKRLKIAFGLDDHQVHIERLRGRAAHRIHDRGTERDVRHEPAVHDVDVDPVGAGLHRPRGLPRRAAANRRQGWRARRRSAS